MDPGDVGWRAILASIERYDTADELLQALLDDGHADAASMGRGAASKVPVESLSQPVSPARSTSSSASSSELVAASKKKRRRGPQTRPKEEIDRLRQTVVDLEFLIKTLQHRAEERRALNHTTQDPMAFQVQDRDAKIVSKAWQAIATRQYQYLRDAQETNHSLRMQLQTQLNIAKSLSRLIRRAEGAMACRSVPHSLIDKLTREYGSRRVQLLALVAGLYQDGAILGKNEVFTRHYEDDYRETRFQKNELLYPGVTVASSTAAHVVPARSNWLASRLWEIARNDVPTRGEYHIVHQDAGIDHDCTMYALSMPTSGRVSEFYGFTARQRFSCADHDVIISVGELRPLASTARPLNSIDICVTNCVAVLPHVSSVELSQVIVHLDAQRHSDAGTRVPEGDSVPVLRHFVGSILRFVHDQLQRQIDSAMVTGHGRCDRREGAAWCM